MKQDAQTRTEIDSKGRKRVLAKHSCACCTACWLYLDIQMCIYGGPFTGYQIMSAPVAQVVEAEA